MARSNGIVFNCLKNSALPLSVVEIRHQTNLPGRTVYNCLNVLLERKKVIKIKHKWVTAENEKLKLIKDIKRHDVYDILENECYFCGYSEILEKHHLIPKSKEIINDPWNILMLCPNCHKLAHLRGSSIEYMKGFYILKYKGKIKFPQEKQILYSKKVHPILGIE